MVSKEPIQFAGSTLGAHRTSFSIPVERWDFRLPI